MLGWPLLVMYSQVRYFLTICYVNYLFFLYRSLLLKKVAFRHSLIKHYKHGIYMTSYLSISHFVATVDLSLFVVMASCAGLSFWEILPCLTLSRMTWCVVLWQRIFWALHSNALACG